MLGSSVEELKVTPTTVRLRLAGTASGEDVRFVVEVSGRMQPDDDEYERVTVVPPARYGIAPFVIDAYTHDMLAATKVAAIMSPERNVPRDVYDLDALAGASPEKILAKRFDAVALQEWREAAFLKVTAIDFDMMREQLLPYIPPDERVLLTAEDWEEKTLRVAERIERWIAAALNATVRPGTP